MTRKCSKRKVPKARSAYNFLLLMYIAQRADRVLMRVQAIFNQQRSFSQVLPGLGRWMAAWAGYPMAGFLLMPKS